MVPTLELLLTGGVFIQAEPLQAPSARCSRSSHWSDFRANARACGSSDAASKVRRFHAVENGALVLHPAECTPPSAPTRAIAHLTALATRTLSASAPDCASAAVASPVEYSLSVHQYESQRPSPAWLARRKRKQSACNSGTCAAAAVTHTCGSHHALSSEVTSSAK